MDNKDKSNYSKFENVINAVEKQGWEYDFDDNGDMKIYCCTPAWGDFAIAIDSEESFLGFKFDIDKYVGYWIVAKCDGMPGVHVPDAPGLVDNARWIVCEIEEMQDQVRELVRAEKQEQAR